MAGFNLHAPNMVVGGALSKPLADYLADLERRVKAAEVATGVVPDDPPLVIQGANGIGVSGDEDAGFLITGQATPVAADIALTDTGGYYAATEVEGALQELGLSLASAGVNITEDTWANVPASPGLGDVHLCTDSPSMARYNSTAWKHRIGTVPVTPPVLADFAWVNQGTSTTSTYGPFTSIVAQAATAYALRILKKSAPATPYTIEAGFLLPPLSNRATAKGMLIGMGFRESTSGKLHVIELNMDAVSQVRSFKYNSATSANAAYFTAVSFEPGAVGLIKFRIRDNGTNRSMDMQGADGIWHEFHTLSRTDFITPDEVFVYLNLQSTATGLPDRVPWVHWLEGS